jgi:sec-independent protein translocase protein TatB
MFDIGLQEMLVIGVLALLVFGPSKLPELGRMVGRAMREFRRASDEFRSTVETNLHINEPDPPPPMPSYAPIGEPAVAPSEVANAPASDRVLPAPAAEHGEPFLAQRSSKLFHRGECAWSARIPELERAYFKSVGDAVDQGFAKCPVCEPWEPA